MTTRLAFILSALIVACVLVDAALFGGAGSLFLARRFADLLEWAAFWR